ncbi:translocation and assembly module lipoprotein TamL [Thermonema rossianum]|uniref:translocation and assembly module lipoprotein TamL n=1 Tax=Thermonema rossianum TaxID=55505 RepID=UPI000570BD30|nr:BamA/TamA family outer membrane protein [Thermonema rossianum]
MHSKAKVAFFSLLSIVLLSGCFSILSLKENEYILYAQEIKTDSLDSDLLEPYLMQRPNRKVFGFMPYVEIYYLGKQFFKPGRIEKQIDETKQKYQQKIEKYVGNNDKVNKLIYKRDKKIKKLETKLKEGNFLMRVVGEPPVILNQSKSYESIRNLREFLHTKGFFDAEVALKIDTISKQGRLAKATYIIHEHIPYRIDSVAVITAQTDLDSLLPPFIRRQSRQMVHYDRDYLDKIRADIETYMRENGYFRFTREYVTIEVDTSQMQKKADIRFVVNAPSRIDTNKVNVQSLGKEIDQIAPDNLQGKHLRYQLTAPYFLVIPSNGGTNRIDTSQARQFQTYDGKHIRVYLADRNFNPDILAQQIHFHEGDWFQESSIRKTQQSLSTLDMFKFININLKDNRSTKLTPVISAAPMEKFSFTSETGLNVVQGLPGPFVNFSLKNRNPFGGMEIFENSFRFAIDGQTSLTDQSQIYSTTEVNYSSSLTIPHFILPKKWQYKFLHKQPKTILGLSFNFTNRPEYTRRNSNFYIKYQWRKLPHYRYEFSPLDINIVNTDRTAALDAFLEQLSSPTIQQSFQNAFITSSYGSWTYNDISTNNVISRFVRFYGESGGAVLNFFNEKILNADNTLFGLNYFKYLKFYTDLRYHYPLSKESTLAMRFLGGAAWPYGNSSTIPYEKFFFAGGSNSIRAWPPRRLGPGSYDHIDDSGNVSYRFEQPGNIILEGSVEYRFKIWWIINGALFVDMGNVWTLSEDTDRPGGQFTNEFWREVAVGTGFGLRFDFTFLLLRLDLGIKAVDPAQPQGNRWVLNNISINKPFSGSNAALLNIGIGYPF